MLINGTQVLGENGTFDVTNPYTGKVVGKAPAASEEQIQQALDLSYKERPFLTGNQRANLLEKIADIISMRKKEFTTCMTEESGLSLKHTTMELARTLVIFREAAKYARVIDEKDRTSEYTKEQKETDPQLTVISEPLDLVVAISPFNLPLHQVVAKIAPALAAGTCMVVKPSERTPLTAMKLEEVIIEAGVPKNMLNFVTGFPPKDIVEKLVTHSSVQLVTFTGGVETGKNIMKMMADAGRGIIKFVPELGGNSALTILDDADIDKAVNIAIFGAFGFNSGQNCTAIKRIIVEEKVADAFIEKFVAETKKLKVGDPSNPQTDIGAMITEDAAIEVEKRVNHALQNGAILLCGNKRKGAVYSPTILDAVDSNLPLVVKETFGPVAPIIRVANVDEAINIINSVPFKLAGGVMTKDYDRAIKISKETAVGQFNWNGAPIYRTEQAPFGGFGDSGNGLKEGVILGAEGMRRIRTFYAHPQ